MQHKSILILAALLTIESNFALAQDDSTSGLNALSDDRLLTDLSRRNVKSLLDRAFEINKTPAGKKEAILASGALSRLQSDDTMPLAERRKLVSDYIKRVPELLKTIRDPQSILADASVVIDNGILTDQRLLEYFGANASVMNRMKPVIDTVMQMLDRSKALSDEAAEKAQANWPAGKSAWERADNQSTIAEYTKNILAYSKAIAMDRASDDRETTLKGAGEYLASFDNEENPNRADLKFYLGKINMERNDPSCAAVARDSFSFVIQKGAANNVAQQFESRLFLVITELNAKNNSGAQQALKNLFDWSRQNKLDAQPETTAALSAMQYRAELLKAEQAKSNKERDATLAAADDILDKLQQSQPGLRGLIMELLGARANSSMPINKLNNLMLQSLRTKAEAETIKPAGEKVDTDLIERGIEASKEIIHRKGKDNPQAITDSYYVIGFFYQKLGKQAEAADAFLDYLDRYKTAEKSRADIAFNNAVSIVGTLYKTQFGDPEVTKMYDRVLDVAIKPPFERIEFAFEYARRLQVTGKTDDSITAYARVAKDRSEYADSRYFLMVALHDKLGKLSAGDKQRTELQKQLQSLADEVNKAFTAKLAGADEKTKTVYRVRLSQTRLLAADVALRDQKDPQRAIDMLNGFEETVAGLPSEGDLLSEVLLIRVEAYVQQDRAPEAQADLEKLAAKRPMETGQDVYNMLEKLDQRIKAASAAGQKEMVGLLERNRAALTPFYVKWIKDNQKEELKKYAYSVSFIDADTQRRAAEVTTDPAKRSELLATALKRFQDLDTPESFKHLIELQEFLEQKSDSENPTAKPTGRPKFSEKLKKLNYDPQVKIGLARAAFAQGDYKAARIPLAILFRDKMLGDGILLKSRDGGLDEVDNPTYWEAMYMLIRCNVALSDNVDGMKQWLANQSQVYGDQIGGNNWGGEFKSLMAELGINPTPTTEPTPK